MSDPVQLWLHSGKSARIEAHALRPVVHPLQKGLPLRVACGQGEVFPLKDKNAGTWFLKKFHPGYGLDPAHLHQVARLLPREDGLRTGFDRSVLSAGSLRRGWGCYYQKELARWLDVTLLMPQAAGLAWRNLADSVRCGDTVLSREDRIACCLALVRLVECLERAGCAHRDFSSGNVFIDLPKRAVALIDFDSLYHRDLNIPGRTTCGTAGYIPPFAGPPEKGDPTGTWCAGGDRFASTILCVEFLLMGPDAPEREDGSLLPQSELTTRSGPELRAVRQQLTSDWPGATGLLDRALAAGSSADCPSPGEWQELCRQWSRPPVTLPTVPNLSLPRRVAVKTNGQAAAARPAPSLADWPLPDLRKPRKPVIVVPLPADPWRP